jgi:hypothetical protein
MIIFYFQQKQQTRLYENVNVVKVRASLHDCDLLAFHKMVKSVRGMYLIIESLYKFV